MDIMNVYFYFLAHSLLLLPLLNHCCASAICQQHLPISSPLRGKRRRQRQTAKTAAKSKSGRHRNYDRLSHRLFMLATSTRQHDDEILGSQTADKLEASDKTREQQTNTCCFCCCYCRHFCQFGTILPSHHFRRGGDNDHHRNQRRSSFCRRRGCHHCRLAI